MGNKTQSGFTIIEVVLFLAISTLLLFVLMAGTASQITRQRYNDGIRSVQTHLQKQYDETLSVLSNRPREERCTTTPEVVTASPATLEERGASKCIILGKAIKFTNGSQEIKSYHVIGIDPPGGDLLSADDGSSDAELIYKFKPTLVTTTEETYRIPWGMSIDSPKSFRIGSAGSTKQDLGLVALLRSPRSGGLVTFSYSNPEIRQLTSVSVTESKDRVANICIANQDIAGAMAMLQMGTLGTQNAVEAHFDIQNNTPGELTC